MKKIIILIAIGLFFTQKVNAQEQIEDFTAVIEIRADGSLLVKEDITYNFDNLKKNEINRIFPGKSELLGGKYGLRFSDFSVQDDGKNPIKFKISKTGNYKKIKILESGKLFSGILKFFIEYQVRRIVNYTDEKDEIYWNAIGGQWPVPIKQSRVLVILPTAISENDLVSQCFSGPKGKENSCISQRYEYFSQGMVKSVSFIEDGLNPGEDFSVLLKVPKGIISRPSNVANIIDIVIANWVIVLPFFVFMVLLLLWLRVRRDARRRGVDGMQNSRKIRNIYTIIGVIVFVIGWFSGPIFDLVGFVGFFVSGVLIIVFGFFVSGESKKILQKNRKFEKI